MSSQLILVTGGSGYLGSHIVQQLLDGGYRVRTTARGAKVDLAKNAFAAYGDRFEVVPVNDLASDDISPYLQGVDKLIHSAAPLVGRGDAATVLNGAIEGSLNVIRQAEKAGIKKIVYTSSIAAVFNSSGSFTENDWNPITREEAMNGQPFTAYVGAKALAEKAVWEFADTHKHVDITTLCPPFVFGPLIPGVAPSTPDFSALSTTLNIYRFLTPKGTFPPFGGYIDVRDLARAHIAALDTPPESEIGRKRVLITSPHELPYKTAVEYIAEIHPELKDRLVDANKAPKHPFDRVPYDLNRVAEVTGVTIDSYLPWEVTIKDTVDCLLALEKDWISKGYEVTIPV